eukprot:sb/3462537/
MKLVKSDLIISQYHVTPTPYHVTPTPMRITCTQCPCVSYMRHGYRVLQSLTFQKICLIYSVNRGPVNRGPTVSRDPDSHENHMHPMPLWNNRESSTTYMKPEAPVWRHFTGKGHESTCNLCGAKVKRGKPEGNRSSWGTDCLWRHLERHHPEEHAQSSTERTANETARKRKRASSAKDHEVYVHGTPTLFTLANKKVKYCPENPVQQDATKKLVEWISDGVLPFALVDNTRFLSFLESLNCKFDCPSEKVLRTKLFPKVYVQVQDRVKKILSTETGESVSLTTDMWTSKTHQCFIGITLHYVDNNFRPKMMVLGCFPFDEDHDAASIRTKITSLVEKFPGLEDKIHLIVRDNAPNLVNALEGTKWNHVGCYTHMLQLVVVHSIYEQEGVKKLLKKAKSLVGYYHHSTSATNKLKKCMADLKLPVVSLIQMNDTRWSSAHDMLNRLLKVKSALTRVQTEIDYTYEPITDAEWKLIDKATPLLAPLAQLTTKGQGETASISQVIPYTKFLLYQLEQRRGREMTHGVCMMKRKLQSMIKNYFQGGDSRDHFPDVESTPSFSYATILDPRFKKNGFKSSAAADIAAEQLTELMAEASSGGETSTEPEPDTLDDSWSRCMGAPSTETATPSASQTDEMEKYLTETLLDREKSPYSWWEVNESKYPNLGVLARRYLGTPMSSSASERGFKVAKRIVEERWRLSPETVEMLLFLKYNFRFV